MTYKILYQKQKVVFYKLYLKKNCLMIKIKEFNSQKEASRELNINNTSISKCCLNKLKTAGGFIFKFL